MPPKILVTGGAGYIGSHTVVALTEAGYEPILVDDFSNSEPRMLQGISALLNRQLRTYTIDCTDPAAMRQVFEQEQLAGIIHFAASKAVGESVEKPLKYYRNNLDSLLLLLELMPQYGVKDLVFSSSCTVYGQPAHLPVTEETPRLPAQSPYGNTKAIGEDIIRDCVTAKRPLRAVSLRYFNPIGAHPSALIGELPRGTPANLVPYLLQVASGQRASLAVHGSDYNTPDGTAIRDYIHVMDLADAHVRAISLLENQADDSFYDVYNIGTGRGQSVLELIHTFEETNGVNLPYTLSPRRPGDIEQIYADVAKAATGLGFTTKRSLADALRDAWQWQQKI